jgi:hypothetical protein
MEAGEILKQALTLPDQERAKLTASLIDSLDPIIDENVSCVAGRNCPPDRRS